MNKNYNFRLLILRIIFPWGIIALFILMFWYHSTHPEATTPVQYDEDGKPCIEADYGPGGAFPVPC